MIQCSRQQTERQQVFVECLISVKTKSKMHLSMLYVLTFWVNSDNWLTVILLYKLL